MPQVTLRRSGMWIALGATLLFGAFGCGSSSSKQTDAAPQTDTGAGVDVAVHPEGGVHPDAGTEAAVPPDDAGQSDAHTNLSGIILAAQVSPAPIATQPGIEALKIVQIQLGWTPATTTDHPTHVLDQRDPATGIGCVASYYDFTVAGTVYDDDSGDAGNVTFGGSWNAVQLDPTTGFQTPLPDSGVPNPMTCTRQEYPSGSGKHKYFCDAPNLPVYPYVFQPKDHVFVNVAGGNDVLPILAKDAGATLPDFPHVTTTLPAAMGSAPALWAMPFMALNPSTACAPPCKSDGGAIGLDYQCGTADAGTAVACKLGDVRVLVIESSDAPPQNALLANSPRTEVGYIRCSSISNASHFDIGMDLWNVAFPPTGRWLTITSSVNNVAPTLTSTLVGVGGGEFGMYTRIPDSGLPD